MEGLASHVVKKGIAYDAVVLRDYFIETILAEKKKRRIPKTPPVALPSRVDERKLGTMSADYELLNKHGDAERDRWWREDLE